MTRNTLRARIAGAIATAALVAVTVGGTAQAADGGGIRNCVDITGKQVNRVGCYELVWANGSQYRMTFSNLSFDGATPEQLDPFYVLAPQTSEPQGAPPNTFPHDHVVHAIPAGNHGTYSTKLQGFFVLCSGQGIATGACVPSWTFLGGPDPVPFAATVHGQALTSTDAIESAAAAGDLFLLNLGPTAVIVGSISAAQ